MPSDERKAEGPKIELEWELAVFRGARALYRKLLGARGGDGLDGRAARLEERERHLTLLAQIVAGAPVRLLATDGDGGLRALSLTLPKALAIADEPAGNAGLYAIRAILAGAMVATDPRRALARDRLSRVEAELDRVSRACAHLAEALPGFAPRWAAACEATLRARGRVEIAGRGAEPELERRVEALRRGALLRGAGLAGLPSDAPERALATSPTVPLWGEILDEPRREAPDGSAPLDDGARPPGAITTEAEAKRVSAIERVELDPRELADAVLTHTFEKIETADEHRGGARDLDGADELDDQQEALDEVTLGKLIRTGEEARSLLRADVDLAAEVPDVASIAKGERGVPYDEWDAKARAYKRGWCTVYPTALARRDARWASAALARNRRVVDEVVRAVQVQRARLAPQRHQRDGDHVDVDAVVRHRADAAAGRADAPRLYTRKARLAHRLATTVLLDLSLSSDAWVGDRRVLDVSREAVLVLGEVGERLGDEIRVLGFASHTRSRCRVFEIRRWGEPWSLARARLGALKPQGYTRIGPALRHAVEEVCLPRSQRRLVLLVSDGKPTDYDRYEGAHGVEDVRQAVREASRRGVWVHGLTVDTIARGYFPAMLGAGHWEILSQVDALPKALAAVYGRMASG